jgi:hypothetical protein
MKRSIVSLVILLTSLSSFAQQDSKEKSNAEKFSDKAGTLIQREFTPIGSVHGCKVEVLRYKDLINGSSGGITATIIDSKKEWRK